MKTHDSEPSEPTLDTSVQKTKVNKRSFPDSPTAIVRHAIVGGLRMWKMMSRRWSAIRFFVRKRELTESWQL
jgi:hypothetical protein